MKEKLFIGDKKAISLRPSLQTLPNTSLSLAHVGPPLAYVSLPLAHAGLPYLMKKETFYIGSFQRDIIIILIISALSHYINFNYHPYCLVNLSHVIMWFLAQGCQSSNEFPLRSSCARCPLRFTSFFLSNHPVLRHGNRVKQA